MGPTFGSYSSYSEPYYTRGDQLNSDGPEAIQIPQSDFDPYYSDIPNYDSELDNNFLSDLGIPQGLNDPVEYNQHFPVASLLAHGKLEAVPEDLDSEPPYLPEDPDPVTYATYEESYVQPRYDQIQHQQPQMPNSQAQSYMASEPAFHSYSNYDDLPSSPPSSPEKFIQRRPVNLDSLGISHPFKHRPQSSISRVLEAPIDVPKLDMPFSYKDEKKLSSGFTDLPESSPSLPISTQRSPYLVPPVPKQYMSPMFTDSSMAPSIPYSGAQEFELSPTLSEASSVSPELESETFTWRPVITAPASEDSEAIIEQQNMQQRKPKHKRKSCLPDGVVDEYVGTTDTEGVLMCLFPNCKRLFKRTYNLRSHIQTHLCDRPYVCRVCDSTFVRPHDLRRHERCHSNAKPFVCPCGKGFNRLDAMQRHRLREICEGAISSGIPKSPRPRGRPKGRKNTPNHSPVLDSPHQTPNLDTPNLHTPNLHTPNLHTHTPVLSQAPVMKPDSPVFVQAPSLYEYANH